jgi:two-component system LytT family sensor kinase
MNWLARRSRRRLTAAGPRAEGVQRIAVLGQAQRIAQDLAEGLSPESAARVIPWLRDLLSADGIALFGSTDPLAASGLESAAPEVAALVRQAAVSGRSGHRAGLHAAPLIVDGEIAGVLVAAGAHLSPQEVRILADWLAASVEHGRMESARADLERAELGRMRAQMSPHFLANSLSAITSLVRSDPERARDLLNRFAEYARHSLATQGDFVTVAEEFRAIEAYLQLERARFGARLSTSVFMAPEVLPVTVPVLVLQPLVENAIRHGIERRPGSGQVVVQGGVLGADCLITVEDDGVGMDPALAQAVLAGRGQHSGIGLANVDRRMRAIYGDEYGLVVETAAEAGTKVTIRLPRSTPAGLVPHEAAGRWSS